MSALTFTVEFQDMAGEDLRAIAAALSNREAVHATIAGATENYLKDFGAKNSENQHDTAKSLGASPTGHLAKAYEQIESQSTADAAILLVPRSSRLRAAFGAYTVEPGPGKKFLTIPVSKAAYGKRAGEFDDLFVVKKGKQGKERLFLARDGDGEYFETMYALVTEAAIPEDATLIPFQSLSEEAGDAVEEFIGALIQSSHES